MHKHGGDIYSNKNAVDFSANLNPMGMPPFVAEAAKNAVDFSSVYPDVQYRKLAQAIAKRENVAVENIICTNGAAELIFAICFALKPKKAVLLCPSFEEYRQALLAVDCHINNYFLKEEQQFDLDEEFLRVLTKDVDMLFICNPNNPTGRIIEKPLMKKIIDRCRENNIFIAVDECFNDFMANREEISVKNQHVFIIKAFTKMYGMAGIRLGYGMCEDTTVLEKIKSCLQPWSVSVVAQAAGVAAANDIMFAEKTRLATEVEKEFLLKEIMLFTEKIIGFGANYIFFKAETQMYKKLLDKGIIIRDCGNFKGLENGFFRIVIKGHRDNLKLIEALQEVYNG